MVKCEKKENVTESLFSDCNWYFIIGLELKIENYPERHGKIDSGFNNFLIIY